MKHLPMIFSTAFCFTFFVIAGLGIFSGSSFITALQRAIIASTIMLAVIGFLTLVVKNTGNLVRTDKKISSAHSDNINRQIDKDIKDNFHSNKERAEAMEKKMRGQE
ncbi:putative membrane protein YhiD involved in acid resistance [Desulfitispora alkaliphila]|uniref:hypothetical protein n=1 Tax=Desulfitispora alkaliphila TaxID=622674 RepID=UPI003D236C73